MKTLNEQITEIINGQKSKSAKRQELIKLGLTNLDVRVLFKMSGVEADANAPEPRRREARNTLARIISKYTFGVEIECFNAPRTALLNAAASNGLHNLRDNRRYYKLVSDASISGNDPVECVSPILKGNAGGFNSLKSCCTALNSIGARVHTSTGLHVHVGGGDYRNAVYKHFRKLLLS